MALNGKTIGRLRPAPDRSKIDEIETAIDDLAAEQAIRTAEEMLADNLSPRERAFNIENTQLKRRLAQAEARVSVMTMGGDGGTRPIGTVFERFKSFEEGVMATEKMTDEHKLKELASMVEDFKIFNGQREKWLEYVEKEAGTLVAEKMGKL